MRPLQHCAYVLHILIESMTLIAVLLQHVALKWSTVQEFPPGGCLQVGIASFRPRKLRLFPCGFP